MDLSKQLDEITKLENELDSLISGSIDRSDLESVKRIEKLEEEQIKLKYQANILQRAILKEKIEAEQNDVLSDFTNVQTDKFVKNDLLKFFFSLPILKDNYDFRKNLLRTN